MKRIISSLISIIPRVSPLRERQQAEAELRSLCTDLERSAFELIQNIPVGAYTMVLPPDGKMAQFSFVSARFLEITGLDAETVLADPFPVLACIHPEDRDDWVQLNTESFEQRTPFFGETRIVVEGQVRWVTAESTPRQLPNGSTVWEGVLTDITDRKRIEIELQRANRELQSLATTDALTGVWNRRHFEAMAIAELQRCDRYDEPLALLLFDVDRFKVINDQFGHLAGDRVLTEVARRVREQLRTVDGLGRWGGEEFALYLPHTKLADALKVAEKLRRVLADSEFPDVGTVTASFGVTAYQPTESLQSCLQRADQALYRAKHQGRNRVGCESDRLEQAG